MKRFFRNLISVYQVFSQALPRSCVFYPSCSEYTKQAITKYGVLKGLRLGIKRISRCHPWQDDPIDPVP